MILRIQGRSAFSRLRREGRHVRSGLLSCTMMCDPSLPGPAVGFALGRSFGPAVARNRLRRRLRAVLAERGEVLPAGLYVLGASPRALALSPAALNEQVDRLLAVVVARSGQEKRP